MTAALQALYSSDFGVVKEDVASGIKLGGLNAGLSTGMGMQGGVFGVGWRCQQATLLSGEVSLESMGGEAGGHRE